MKVYHVQAEGETRIVEAESYGKAVAIFLAAMRREFGDSWDDAEPDSVSLLSDEPVLREANDG